jgi:anthranilate synthase component 1
VINSYSKAPDYFGVFLFDMPTVKIETTYKRLLADVYTPVGIYLRLRDRFRDTILLESTDHHAMENSWSFICINALAGIEISTPERVELKFPGQPAERRSIQPEEITGLLWKFMQAFECNATSTEKAFAQGLYGYTSYDAVRLFDTIKFQTRKTGNNNIPLMRYRFYQYVIAFNHYRDELFICENRISGIESEIEVIESLIKSRDVPLYPFSATGEEQSNMTDEDYLQMVRKGIESCYRGDVFQIVLSRSFSRPFRGDEFNIYRALRSINPSPYLFYFDYGDYRLMGSSPEAQLVIKEGQALVHPIAGTYKRTGDDIIDQRETRRLLEDAKENAEHVMLVDLARNDLSRACDEVSVARFRQVQYYSHVIHLVSEVIGKVRAGANPFDLLAKTFPAGTLSGAPKFRAMELIDQYEPTSRGYYGGAIGFMGFDGSCNHAILIRSFLSRKNTIFYQAGAGIVAASVPMNELQEVNNKLGALKKSIDLASMIDQ